MMPSLERRYPWRPAWNLLPRSLTTSIRRNARSSARSVPSAMIPSATADSGAEVLVVHRPADRIAIEEAERLAVAEHLFERLGDRGEVDRGALLRRAGEDKLL